MSQKWPPFYYFEYFCQKLTTDFNDFCTWNPEKIFHQQLIDLPTSPVSCSPLSWEIQKVIFTNIIHAYLLFTFSPNKTNVVVNLPITPEKMSPHYHSCCGMYIVSFQTLVALKRRVVLYGTSGCERSRLCCVATWMSGKQQCKHHSKCSTWPPSAWIHASSLFHHWLIASSTTLCWTYFSPS